MKKAIVLFIKESAGELFVTLPLLAAVKERVDNLNIYFVSLNPSVINDLKIDDFHRNKINDLGETYFGIVAYLKLLVRLVVGNKVCLLFTCNNGTSKVENLYFATIIRSLLIFYHHAYSLHGSFKHYNKNSGVSAGNKGFTEKYSHGSHLLIFSKQNTGYYVSEGWDESLIHIVGATGYSNKWQDEMLNFEGKTFPSSSEGLTFFVPIRGPHPIYLTETSYAYLVASVFRITDLYPQHTFIIKPHPRQQDVAELHRSASARANVYISDLNTMILARSADLTISFWSSAIQDSLAAGTPAIEFHRHEVQHDQLTRNEKGMLISLYHDFGFCGFIDNFDELSALIASIDKQHLEDMLIRQRKCFEQVFDLDDHLYEIPSTVISNLFYEANSSSLHITKYKLWIFANIVRTTLFRKLSKIRSVKFLNLI